MKTLQYIWALPVTLVGLIVAVFGGSTLTKIHGVAMVFVVKPGGLIDRFFRSGRFDGLTIGACIFIADAWYLRYSRLMAHEYRHVMQVMTWGPLFPVLYYGSWLVAWARGGHYYEDCWFERDARRAELDV